MNPGTLAQPRWLIATGWMMTLAASVFVVRELIEYWQPLDAHLTEPLLASMAVAIPAYFLLLLGVVLTWGVILRALDDGPVTWSGIVAVNGRAQLIKYLPGNIFHFASRQVQGARLGWSQLAIGLSSVWEIILLILCAAMLGAGSGVQQLLSDSLIMVVGLSVVIAGLLAWAIAGNWKKWQLRWPVLSRLGQLDAVAPGPVLIAAVGYTVFLAGSGLVLYQLLGPVARSIELLDVIAIYALAWLIGYLTPGAPGGLGLREGALVILLAPLTGDAAALAAALSMRVVTISGDALMFVLSLWPARRLPQPDH